MQRRKRKRASTASTAGEDDEADVKMYSPDVAQATASSRNQGRRVRSAQSAFPWSVGYDEKMRSWIEYGTTPEEQKHSVLPTDVQRLIASKLHPCDLVPNLNCNKSKVYRDPFGVDPLQEINCTDYCVDLCRKTVHSILTNAPRFVTFTENVSQVATKFPIAKIEFMWKTVKHTPSSMPDRVLTLTVILEKPDQVFFHTVGWSKPSVGDERVPGQRTPEGYTVAHAQEAASFICNVSKRLEPYQVYIEFESDPSLQSVPGQFGVGPSDSFYNTTNFFVTQGQGRDLLALVYQ